MINEPLSSPKLTYTDQFKTLIKTFADKYDPGECQDDKIDNYISGLLVMPWMNGSVEVISGLHLMKFSFVVLDEETKRHRRILKRLNEFMREYLPIEK